MTTRPAVYLRLRARMLGTACIALLLCAPLSAQDSPEPEAARLVFDVQPLPAAGAPAANPFPEAPASSTDEANAMRAALASRTAAIGTRDAEAAQHSDALAAELVELGTLHQALGDHDQALAAFARAQAVTTALHGAEAPELVPILGASAWSLQALGRFGEADAAQEETLRLGYLVHTADLAGFVPELERVADWYLQAYLERSQIRLGINRRSTLNFPEAASMGNVGTRLLAVETPLTDPVNLPRYKLTQARDYYSKAINILGLANDVANPRLLALERSLRTALFLDTHHDSLIVEPDFYLNRRTQRTGSRLDTSALDITSSPFYHDGRASFERALAYVGANRQRTAEQIATVLLEEADWDLLYERAPEAREKYAEAQAFFADNPAMAAVAALTAPQLPVVLPAFLPAPNSRARLGLAADAPLHYLGYVDVSFRIDGSGDARDIEWLGTGGAITPAIERRLEDYVNNVRFRPRFRDGEVDATPLRLRYSIAY